MTNRHVSGAKQIGPVVSDRWREVAVETIKAVRPYTMVPDEGIAQTIYCTLDAMVHDVPGALVECGTWRGGCSFAMLIAQLHAFGRIIRSVWMYDSFQGMSAPSPEDGTSAAQWYHASKSGQPDVMQQNWCVADVETVEAAAVQLGLVDHVRIIPGWFSDTLGAAELSPVAMLRIDCDWYDPVLTCLEHFEPRMSPNGYIILDDYYAWQGCALAAHDFLSANELPWPIVSAEGKCGAWMRKPL
jgi:hypothetical protein